MEKLGILVLGQTPRPDIEALLACFLPGAELILEGALDGLERTEIEDLALQGGDYPLLVILSDGTTREISMNLLVPRLSTKAKHLASAGASAAILFCAGDFPDIDSSIPILYPGRIIPAMVQGISRTRRVGIITPNPGQAGPARRHWEDKKFSVKVVVASPKNPGELESAAPHLQDPTLELIVLDCMGFQPAAALRLKSLTGKPVLCSQSLVARTAAEIIGSYPALRPKMHGAAPQSMGKEDR